MRTVAACLLALAGLLAAQNFQEPPLREIARSTSISKNLPESNPRPEGAWPRTSTPAVNLSTTRMKVSLWGPPDRLTVSLGKTDVWDRRRSEWEKPLTLAEIREGAYSPSHQNDPVAVGAKNSGYPLQDGRWAERYGSWRKPYPSPKPVGQAILLIPDLAGAAPVTAVVRCDDGTARVSARRGATSVDVTYLSMMSRNLIAIGLEGSRLARGIALRLYRHTDTTGTGIDAPESGSDGRFFWVRQRLPAEKTFPGGFEYVVMGVVSGARAGLEAVNGERGLGTRMDLAASDRKTLWGGHLPKYDGLNNAAGSAATARLAPLARVRATVFLVIATSAESATPFESARAELQRAERLGLQRLIGENAAWYRRFYDRREDGRILGGDPAWTKRRLTDLFRSWNNADWDDEKPDGHPWLTNPDPARYEADEVYAHLEADVSPWHGLPCLNEVYGTQHAVLNHADRLAYYAALVNHWLEASRKNAREVFGLPGMFGPAHGYLPPIKADEYPHIISSWEFCMEIPAQVLKAAWDIWDYGGDEQYLARRVYPALRELATFYAAYLTPGADGFYHAVPTMSAEHWGWTYRFERNRDSASALGLIKWTLQAAADASELLGRDADRRAAWRRTAAKMAPYPTCETPEGPVYADVAGVNPAGVGYNFFAGVTPTLLADQITLDSHPREIEIMLRTARLVGGWANDKVFHLLGASPELVKGAPASMFFPARQDVPIATRAQLLDVVAREPERLLNSRSGRIHVFPCVPRGATVAFRNFQARGGFLVSAEMVNGRVTHVRVTARRNVVCRLQIPWPGGEIVVKREPDAAPVAVKDNSFAALAGESYLVEKRETR